MYRAASLMLLAVTATAVESLRHAAARELRSGDLAVEVMEPTSPQRYNTGTRFSPVAAVLRMTWKGRDLLFNPVVHDPVLDHCGLAQEFDLYTPLGFAGVAEGGSFLKLGVGVLTKTTPHYQFYTPQPVVRLAETTVAWRDDGADFTQTCTLDRYSYRYEVQVRLAPPALSITYRLVNTGSEIFATEQYAHNFLRLDDRAPVAGLRLIFPTAMVLGTRWVDEANMRRLLRMDGTEVRLLSAIGSETAPYVNAAVRPVDGGVDPGSFEAFQPGAPFSLECAVRGQPVGLTRIHANPLCVCPEQFVRVELMPGQHAAWERRWAVREAAAR